MPSNDANSVEEKPADVIHSLLNGTPFKLRPDDEKLAILQKGRPLYNINVTKQGTSRNANRVLHSSWYSVYKWLCGSTRYNKFFCWPCLLMRPETSSWCSIGNDGITRFSSLATKHARCKSHLKAVCEYDETLLNLNLNPELVSESKFDCKEECMLDETEIDIINNKDGDEDENDGEYEEEIDDDDDEDDEDDEDDDDDDEEDDDDDDDDDNEDEQDDNSDDDSVSLHLKNRKKSTKQENFNNKVKVTAAESAEIHSPSKNSRITFKTWKELYKDAFPVSKTYFYQDFQMSKWKKKIAKQELRNARLVAEKLKFEIQLLKVKLEYYKALKEDT